jgi:hypothetical protein
MLSFLKNEIESSVIFVESEGGILLPESLKHLLRREREAKAVRRPLFVIHEHNKKYEHSHPVVAPNVPKESIRLHVNLRKRSFSFSYRFTYGDRILKLYVSLRRATQKDYRRWNQSLFDRKRHTYMNRLRFQL